MEVFQENDHKHIQLSYDHQKEKKKVVKAKQKLFKQMVASR